MDHYAENTIQSFDNTPIWYRRMGSHKPTIVLCDGVGCDGFIWKYIIKHFEEKYHIIHYNYRGHGKSPFSLDQENYGIEECAQDLKCVLDHAQITEPIFLLGHSMGVQVIFEFHNLYPERVKALIPVTGSYGKALDHVHDNGIVKKMFPILKYSMYHLRPIAHEIWTRLINSELAFIYSKMFEVNPKLTKREDLFPYLEHLSQMEPIAFIRSLEGAARHTAESYLSEIKIPTLIIASDKDQFTPYWISQRMHALIPGSEMLTLHTGSHIGPLEMPELTCLKIEKFIDQKA
jgi:pimeloyl-ACP methyl ester carboxylesterase